MSYPQRLSSIEAIRSVATEGPIRLRFPETGNRTMLVDALTASAITAVYDALNEENQGTLARAVRDRAGFMRVVGFAFKHVRGTAAK